jgi:Trk-type K+ transport system membrane component
MEIWRDFLDSLETRGGIVFLLFVLLWGLLFMAQWNSSSWVLRFLDMTAGAFFGALLGRVATANGNGAPPRVPPTG